MAILKNKKEYYQKLAKESQKHHKQVNSQQKLTKLEKIFSEN
jgi:hypothetical protein